MLRLPRACGSGAVPTAWTLLQPGKGSLKRVRDSSSGSRSSQLTPQEQQGHPGTEPAPLSTTTSGPSPGGWPGPVQFLQPSNRPSSVFNLPHLNRRKKVPQQAPGNLIFSHFDGTTETVGSQVAEGSLAEAGGTWLSRRSSNHKGNNLSHSPSNKTGLVLGIEPEISLFTGMMVDAALSLSLREVVQSLGLQQHPRMPLKAQKVKLRVSSSAASNNTEGDRRRK